MTEKKRKFVYIIYSQPKSSNHINNRHINEKKNGMCSVYGLYETYSGARNSLNEIYEEGILGVKYNTEYIIVKQEIIKEE